MVFGTVRFWYMVRHIATVKWLLIRMLSYEWEAGIRYGTGTWYMVRHAATLKWLVTISVQFDEV